MRSRHRFDEDLNHPSPAVRHCHDMAWSRGSRSSDRSCALPDELTIRLLPRRPPGHPLNEELHHAHQPAPEHQHEAGDRREDRGDGHQRIRPDVQAAPLSLKVLRSRGNRPPPCPFPGLQNRLRVTKPLGNCIAFTLPQVAVSPVAGLRPQVHAPVRTGLGAIPA